MSAEPSFGLIELIEQLQLASRDEVLAVARRARKLARGLPTFDSVWIDALLQEEILTPFQAVEMNAGRGQQLQVVDFVLINVLESPAFGRQYLARRLSAANEVRLLVVDIPTTDVTRAEKQLKTTISISRRLNDPALLPIIDGGVETTGSKSKLWCACARDDGITASRWLVPHGRVPQQAALHVARQMARALAELERFEMPHGDLSTVNLIWDEHGGIRLPWAGVRSVVRTDEGHGRAELAPEAYDYLAPERVVAGTPADKASELYAFGALCWHLLAGRPPIPGGDSPTKLRNIQKARVPDIRTIAPDTSEFFAQVIGACLSEEPEQRGGSFDQIVAKLGSVSRVGAAELQQCVYRHTHPQPVRDSWSPRRTAPRQQRRRIALVSAAALLLFGIAWYAEWPRSAPTVDIPPPRTNITDATPRTVLNPPQPDAPPVVATEAATAVEQRTLEPNVVLVSEQAAANGQLPRLSAGVTVRGDPQKRPLFRVPAAGIALDLPHVRFENIDFVWEIPNDSRVIDRPALFRLGSRWVEFYRCSFQGGDLPFGHQRPVAIVVSKEAVSESTPAVNVIMDQCVLRDVEAGVEIAEPIALTYQAQGTLHLGPGPLIDVQMWPLLDLPIRLALQQCTLRNSAGLITVQGGYDTNRPGHLSVLAEYCVFSPRADGSLVTFENSEQIPPILRQIRWSGHSSLLAPEAAILARRSLDGRMERIDDSPIAVEGLIRGDFGFESPRLEIPAASRLRKWSLPTRGAARPGIDDVEVYLPKIGER